MFNLDEDNLRQEYAVLEAQLAQTDVYQREDYPQIAKRFKELNEILGLLDRRQLLEKQKREAQTLSQDKDQALANLAFSEATEIADTITDLDAKLKQILKNDQANPKECLIEIRAGVGGSEASLFAGDLYRMYHRFSEKQNWRLDLISQSPSEVGGFKEIILEIKGHDVYQMLQFESGVHRVQRIPATESQGRIHTSTVSVAVMPKAKVSELQLKPEDLQIDTYRSSGHGGQSVNKTDSAVRITHLPSGLVVTCQDEKSQFKNKAKALSILRSRLLQQQTETLITETSHQRQQLIGKAMRNEKIRTYNYPQDRVTDHRINYSLSNLANVLNGDLNTLLHKLQIDLA